MVTISRQAGTGGDEIARVLAEELGWNFLDKEVLERLLVERGFPKMEVEIYDEKKPGFWHRFSAERDRYLHFLKMVSYEFARRGSCVIVGRGGQILFKDVPGTINVRVVAPLQDRVMKVREKFGYNFSAGLGRPSCMKTTTEQDSTGSYFTRIGTHSITTI